MGWTLVQNGTRQRLRLKPGKTQIGRAQAAQIRPTHQSVSRLHAEIVVGRHAGLLADVLRLPIHIVDTSSTGHTFVNGRPVGGKGTSAPLAEGDSLSFGVDPATFTVHWSPVLLSCSGKAEPSEMQRMDELARAAGTFLTSDWTSDCTHLLMERLSITPKLLCCVTSGGVPVTPTFLNALSECETGAVPPDVAQFRPLPPIGPDAAYVGELEACCQAPRARRHLLSGIWVLFGSQPAFEILSKALVFAGSDVHLLCTTEAEATKIGTDLRRAADSEGAERLPREIWAVPFLPAPAAAAMAEHVRTLPIRAIIVPMPAMVAGIFSGSLDSVHAKASPLMDVSSQYPETQQQGARRQGIPLSAVSIPATGATPCQPKKIKEEDSFANTQRNNGHVGQPTTSSVAMAGGVGQKESNAKTPPDVLPSETGKRPGGLASGLSQLDATGQAKRRRFPMTLTAVKDQDRGQDEKAEKDLTLSGNLAGFAVKTEDKVQPRPDLQHKADEKPPATINSSYGASGGASRSRRQQLTIDASQFSQVKEEPKQEAARANGVAPQARINLDTQASSQVQVKNEQPKVEQKLELPPEQHRTNTFPKASNLVPRPDAEPAAERVEHPVGVWLPGRLPKKAAIAKGGEEAIAVVTTDGVDVQRAAWQAGVVEAVVPKLVVQGHGNGGAHRAVRQNFKLFRKSDGQLRRARGPEGVVPLQPWVPAAGPSLAEVFASQPMESQSQLPPMGMV